MSRRSRAFGHHPLSPRLVTLGVLGLSLTSVAPAAAGALTVVPTRAQGMGGALRGGAAGTSAPALNPSGISLVRSYVVEGGYHFLQDQEGHLAQVALSDSTSASNVGGGLTYTYATGSIGGVETSRHEGGLSLSFPFGDYVAVGASARYLNMSTAAVGGEQKQKGFTFDAGLSLRPSPKFALGLVGYGLKDMKNAQAPRAFGGGLLLSPLAELIVTGDAVLDQQTHDPAAGNAWSFMGGAEYTFAGRFAARAGGGHDGVREAGYVTAGFSALTEAGALDVGGRIDLGGENPLYAGVALRIFVPSP